MCMMDWLWKAADRDIQALHAATQQYQCVMLQLIGYAGRVQLIGYCLEGADTCYALAIACVTGAAIACHQ